MFLLNCSYTECCDVCNIPERSKTHAAEKSWFWTILKSQFSSADKRRIDSKRSIELAKLAREWSARAFLERVDGSETGVWWLSEKQREKRGRREKKKKKKKETKDTLWAFFLSRVRANCERTRAASDEQIASTWSSQLRKHVIRQPAGLTSGCRGTTATERVSVLSENVGREKNSSPEWRVAPAVDSAGWRHFLKILWSRTLFCWRLIVIKMVVRL